MVTVQNLDEIKLEAHLESFRESCKQNRNQYFFYFVFLLVVFTEYININSEDLLRGHTRLQLNLFFFIPEIPINLLFVFIPFFLTVYNFLVIFNLRKHCVLFGRTYDFLIKSETSISHVLKNSGLSVFSFPFLFNGVIFDYIKNHSGKLRETEDMEERASGDYLGLIYISLIYLCGLYLQLYGLTKVLAYQSQWISLFNCVLMLIFTINFLWSYFSETRGGAFFGNYGDNEESRGYNFSVFPMSRWYKIPLFLFIFPVIAGFSLLLTQHFTLFSSELSEDSRLFSGPEADFNVDLRLNLGARNTLLNSMSDKCSVEKMLCNQLKNRKELQGEDLPVREVISERYFLRTNIQNSFLKNLEFANVCFNGISIRKSIFVNTVFPSSLLSKNKDDVVYCRDSIAERYNNDPKNISGSYFIDSFISGADFKTGGFSEEDESRTSKRGFYEIFKNGKDQNSEGFSNSMNYYYYLYTKKPEGINTDGYNIFNLREVCREREEIKSSTCE